MSILYNHLTSTLRHLWKNPGSTSLNITGLMLGVTCSIIIFLTIQYEFSFDRQHSNAGELYRVTNDYHYPTFTMHVGQTPDPMATALQTDFLEFTRAFPIVSSYDHNISVAEEILESDILYCGPEFIQAFDYYNDPDQWIIGDPNEILNKADQTILTEDLAVKLFDSPAAAIGKIIELSNEIRVEVAGVMRNPPRNTNYPFEQLISYRTYERVARMFFGGVSSTTTLVQIPPAVTVASLRPALDAFNEKYMEAAWGEDFVTMDLQPLSEIHFDERYGSNSYTTNRSHLWTLGMIGLFMVLIACINFVNLATARAASRSREIGMRKILGSARGDIVKQFMSESFFLASLALVLGMMLAQAAFPYFSSWTNLNIGNSFHYGTDLLLFIGGLLIFITLAMGLYPAIILSRFKPLQVIRQNQPTLSSRGLNLRRGLIAFQLTTSQVMVIAALVITFQLQLFQSKDLGFARESMLVIPIHGEVTAENRQTLKDKVEAFPFVKQASLASTIPMSGHHSTTALTSRDSEIKERFNVEYIYADNDYVDAMNFELLAGKGGVTMLEEDTVRGFVVNETLVNRLALGTPSEAVGKQINVHGYDSRIIGVVRDYHTMSLHERIRPVAVIYGVRNYADLAIRYQTEDLKSTIAQLEGTWKTVFPDKNFDYYFQDEEMGDMYDNEIRFSKIIRAFTIISIIIACIGLIGLATFSSARRRKEIGVRKVLGATVTDILVLMSREFVILALIGFVLSVPLAYLLVSGWLQGFAYHIDLEWWMAVVSGLLILIVTLVTVGGQSIRTALVNPVDSLRNE